MKYTGPERRNSPRTIINFTAVAAICLSSSFATARVRLQTFLSDTIAHSIRVKQNMHTLNNQLQFGVRHELVDLRGSIHDIPKTMSLKELRTFGYKHELTIAERLAQVYGIHRDNMTREQREEFENCKLWLNTIEEIIKMTAEEKLNPTSSELLALDSLERVGDLTDTGINRQNEIPGDKARYNGARFLKELGFEQESYLSKWLEDFIFRKKRMACQKASLG